MLAHNMGILNVAAVSVQGWPSSKSGCYFSRRHGLSAPSAGNMEDQRELPSQSQGTEFWHELIGNSVSSLQI
jgi:hypothetical protein